MFALSNRTTYRHTCDRSELNVARNLFGLFNIIRVAVLRLRSFCIVSYSKRPSECVCSYAAVLVVKFASVAIALSAPRDHV